MFILISGISFNQILFFIDKIRTNIINNQRINAYPDLAIEIISPSTAYYDLIDKKELYERYGVKEYWLVDPLKKESRNL